MINVAKVLPILQKSIPGASPEMLTASIKKFEQVHPNINDMQFLALMQEYAKRKQTASQGPRFSGLVNQLGDNTNV